MFLNVLALLFASVISCLILTEIKNFISFEFLSFIMAQCVQHSSMIVSILTFLVSIWSLFSFKTVSILVSIETKIKWRLSVSKWVVLIRLWSYIRPFAQNWSYNGRILQQKSYFLCCRFLCNKCNRFLAILLAILQEKSSYLDLTFFFKSTFALMWSFELTLPQFSNNFSK